MNSSKRSSPRRVPVADPPIGASVRRAIVLCVLTLLVLPSEAATVYFSFQDAVATLPVFNGIGLLLLAMGLVWLAHRHLSKAAATTLCLLMLAPGSLLLMDRLQAMGPLLQIDPTSEACAGGSDSLEFDPYLDGLTLENGCATQAVTITAYDLPCSPAAVRAAALPVGTQLQAGQASALSYCDRSFNEPPSFTLPSTTVTVDEDSGALTLPGFVQSILPGPDHESGQSVSFTVTNNHTELFATAPAIDASGTLTFTGAADAFGVAEVQVVGTDTGGASSQQTFTLNIAPVNDAPSFSMPATYTLLEDNGLDTDTVDEPFTDTLVTLPGFVTAITPGNSWEAAAGEGVGFDVRYLSGSYQFEGNLPGIEPTERPQNVFFAPATGGAPAVVTAGGDLVFTLRADIWGTVELEVVAVDDGGQESTAQTLTLTIDPVFDAYPAGRDIAASGNENSGCIPITLQGTSFRNLSRRHFIITSLDLAGGELYSGATEIAAANLPFITSSSGFCYVPPIDEHSVEGADGLEPFASFTYRVWSGEGDPVTGESPPLGSSGQFLELSPTEYTVEIVVRPFF